MAQVNDNKPAPPPPPRFAPQAGQPGNDDWNKKIIKTANIKLELKDYVSFNRNIHQELNAYGAFIASENQVSNDERIENNITIKVPVDQFENLVNSFSGKDIKVLEKNITSEDVTSEVIDVKARLDAKKQVRDRYLDLLKQAKNMKDILAVHEEINTIQEDIESATGRANYLVRQAAFSTIHLNYFHGVAPKESVPTFFTRLKESFDNGITVTQNLILFIINLWPIIIVALAGLIFYRKYQLRKS